MDQQNSVNQAFTETPIYVFPDIYLYTWLAVYVWEIMQKQQAEKK